MKLVTWMVCALVCALTCCASTTSTRAAEVIKIGSKSFTESVILGEMLTALAGCKQFAGDKEIKVQHLAELGGNADPVESLAQR